MKNNISQLILAGLFATATALPAATILTGDFTSHGGTTASISSSTITAGSGISSIDTNLSAFAAGSSDTFEIVGDSANYAVVDQRDDAAGTDPNNAYFTFDFTTSDWQALSLTGVSADVNRMRANGNFHSTADMGTGSFDIYEGAGLIGSLSTTWGVLGGGTTGVPNSADKTVSFTGAPILLEAATTYSVRFANDQGNQGGFVGFSSFEVSGDISVVPEPSSTALLGLGGLALMLRRKRS
jgi:hypothetical protein